MISEFIMLKNALKLLTLEADSSIFLLFKKRISNGHRFARECPISKKKNGHYYKGKGLYIYTVLKTNCRPRTRNLILTEYISLLVVKVTMFCLPRPTHYCFV